MEKTNTLLFDAQPHFVGVTLKSFIDQSRPWEMLTTWQVTTNCDQRHIDCWAGWLLLQFWLMGPGLIDSRMSRLKIAYQLAVRPIECTLADWYRLGRLNILLHQLIGFCPISLLYIKRKGRLIIQIITDQSPWHQLSADYWSTSYSPTSATFYNLII